MLEKRGQVTIFIIIGIVILISGVLLYYIAAQRVEVELPEKFIRETPDAILPVRYYVDDCISLVAREAVEEIGLHGGWIQDPELASRIFEYSYDPTEGEAVQFSQNSAAIPYWFYMTSSNDCGICQFSQKNMPTLATMSGEINRYIDSRLDRCLGNLVVFEEQGFRVRKTGDIETSASIIDGAVLIKVKLPLDIRTGGQRYALEDFAVSLPVNLKGIYELAVKILTKQANVGFVERNLLNLISYSCTLDPDALPPIYAVEFGANKVFWAKTAVQEKIRELMLTYTSFMTVPGTHNFQIYRQDENSPGYRLRQGLFTGFVMNVLEGATGYEDIDVSFNYLNWPFYFDITPRSGELLGPDDWDGNFMFVQIFSKIYQFNYDISFPAVVELRDTTAFNQEGYSFMFALEGNIRNNEVLRGNLPEFGMYGEERADLFKDPSQWISGQITVRAWDGEDEPVAGANIRYTCGSDTVNAGQTDSSGIFRGSLPLCRGGVLRVEKQGYYGDGKYLDAEIDKKVTVDAVLYRLQKKKATIKVRWPGMDAELALRPNQQLTFSELLSLLNSYTRDVTGNESIILSMTRIGEEADPPLANFLSIDGDHAEGYITLVPGKYEVQSTYMWLPGVYIPASTYSVEGEDIPLPEINITPSPLGGAVLDSESGYWNVVPDYLNEGEAVTFYVIREQEPTSIFELSRISNYINSSKNFRSIIEPTWS